MSKLIIEDQRGRKTNIPLARDTVTVGRQEGATIRLNERNVSRRHLELRREAGVLYAVDVSRFGSILNTRRFSGRVRLYDGDVLQVGDYKLLVELDEPRPEPRPPVPPAWLDYGKARLLRYERGLVHKTWRIGGPVVLGSDPVVDIAVTDARVLRSHATIRPLEEGWLLEVCDPATTLRVNDIIVQRRRLEHGDVLRLGRYEFRWVPERVFAVSVDPVDIGEDQGVPKWRRWSAVGLLAESTSLAPANYGT